MKRKDKKEDEISEEKKDSEQTEKPSSEK